MCLGMAELVLRHLTMYIKPMKKLLSGIATAMLLMMPTAPVLAQAGASCNSPIRFGKNYSDNIAGAGTKWYVANTFDLPLTVKFYPNNSTAQAPEILMDFSCTSGVYDDSIVCSIFCTGQGSYLTLPYTVAPDRKTDPQGRVYYEVAIGEFYRDMLLSAGISYDLDVFVKVKYYCAGTINITPDAEFSECMETDQWLLLGRTLQVAANDQETFFIAPYANWQQDSVRYIWSGAQPATVVLGTTCDFEPLNGEDERRIDVMNMRAGGDTANHTNADIRYYMTYMRNPTNTAKGGMFYVKVVSAGSGTLKVEHMPETPPAEGAVLLQYGQPNPIAANNTQLYAISRTWTSATLLETPTDHVFKMFIGTTADFTTETAFVSYAFNRNENGHWYGLTNNDMAALWNQVPTGQKFLYVRFECTEVTTLTPSEWTPSDCYEKAELIHKNDTLDIAMRSKDIYRIFYADWQGGDMYVHWEGQKMCKMLVSGSCTIGTNGSAASVIYYQEMEDGTTYTITAAELTEMATSVDEDGYIYMRFYSDKAGRVALSTTAPEETDPEEPDPLVPRVTVSVTCLESTTGIQIRVSTPQSIRILDAAGTEIWQQTVQPGQPQDIPLQSGIYMLIGENEHIEIHL